MHKTLITSLFTLLIILKGYSSELPKFKDGQTVCYIGNSITQAGTYHMLLQAYYATRFPGNKVKFISCGVSGDNAPGMIDRFEKDILIHKPDYAFLMTGMNDMYSELFSPRIKIDSVLLAKREGTLKKYQSHTNNLVELLITNNIKPILMTPSIYDQTARIKTPSSFGKNDALVKCAKLVRELGQKYNAPIVDLNPFMLQINQEAQKKDSSFTIIGQDRVHPAETGHFIMAYKIINTLFPSGNVSSISINAKKNTIKEIENCEVELKHETKHFSFSSKAASLPFPLKNEFKKAQQFVPFMETNNKETLQLSGLKKGNYILKIDGITVDTLSTKELKKGVNMASNQLTPQYKQAEDVFDLCAQYHKIQSDLRIIALVQHRNLKTYNGVPTLDAQKAYLAIQVEKNKGKSWYEYTKKICKKYFEVLPHEKDLWEKLEQIRNEIYSSNIPTKHTYQFFKLN